MKMTTELATTLENFQQACVQFTGPYNDAHDRLCRLAYESADKEISQEDLDWLKELTSNLSSEAESLEGEIDTALDMFHTDVEEIEGQCEHGVNRELADCSVCEQIEEG
jgi:hypothetical protein